MRTGKMVLGLSTPGQLERKYILICDRYSNGTSIPALMRTAETLIYVALYTGSVHPVCADW